MDNLFDSVIDNLLDQIKPVCEQLESLPIPERIEAINKIRLALHAVSPFKDEPVDCVLWIQSDKIYANDYNPNFVATPEMKSLIHSIDMDGYTMPIVGWQETITGDSDTETETVDGFHRSKVGKEIKRIKNRLMGYLPVSLINGHRGERKDRMASTIRHNRARGVHAVDPMTSIVAELHKRGWEDDKIAKELGMDADEVLRFKHNSGLPELFKDHEYSKAWE